MARLVFQCRGLVLVVLTRGSMSAGNSQRSGTTALKSGTPLALAPFSETRWLHDVLVLAMHAIPHAYRHVSPEANQSLVVAIEGGSGGSWTLRARASGWEIDEGSQLHPSASVTMSDEVAWRLFFNALPLSGARSGSS